MFSDEQVEAAVRALSDPERFADAERLVTAAAPQLHRVLAHALNEGGWFGPRTTRRYAPPSPSPTRPRARPG